MRALLEAYAPTADAHLEHPYFAGDGPCTLLIDEIEALWKPIAQADDWSLFEAKLKAIAGMGEAYGAKPASPVAVTS